MKTKALVVQTDSSNQALLRIAGLLNRFRVKVRSFVSQETGGGMYVTILYEGDSRLSERLLQQSRRFVEVWDAQIHDDFEKNFEVSVQLGAE